MLLGFGSWNILLSEMVVDVQKVVTSLLAEMGED
jgi:hypothetical protein